MTMKFKPLSYSDPPEYSLIFLYSYSTNIYIGPLLFHLLEWALRKNSLPLLYVDP